MRIFETKRVRVGIESYKWWEYILAVRFWQYDSDFYKARRYLVTGYLGPLTLTLCYKQKELVK